jgi:hypothetical protein
MDSDSTIVEVSLIRGDVLITFADEMIALLKPEAIRQLAITSLALKRPPRDAVSA